MKNVITFLVVAVSFLFGCGKPASATCGARSGSYRFVITSQSGNCGNYESVVVVNGASSDTSNCTGSSTETADHCDVTMDTTCPTGSGGTLAMRGTVNWSDDGNYGSGTSSLTITDNQGVLCDGVVSLYYQKI